jgi:hypothetical protein
MPQQSRPRYKLLLDDVFRIVRGKDVFVIGFGRHANVQEAEELIRRANAYDSRSQGSSGKSEDKQ